MIARMLFWSRMRERVAVDLLRWTPKGTLSRGIGWAAGGDPRRFERLALE